MDLTLSEIESLTSVTRYQISRYTTDGRLTRTSQGRYDAASLANLAPPFDPYAAGRRSDRAEEKAIHLVRAEHSFRRELCRIVEDRHRDAGDYGRHELTPAELREIDGAVKAYVAILAGRPDR
jgi:hypothetical protein